MPRWYTSGGEALGTTTPGWVVGVGRSGVVEDGRLVGTIRNMRNATGAGRSVALTNLINFLQEKTPKPLSFM